MTKEEAIEIYNGLINEKIKEAFEFFAPELTESEDEKIRKEIVEFLKLIDNGTAKVHVWTNTKKWIPWLEKQKEQKPKQVPKWLYRLEFKDASCGLWYDGNGKWCFDSGIGSLDDSCKTKSLPMDYDWRYKQDGRNWFSSCSRKEDLLHWYSKEDARKLLANGFIFTRYLATEYHEYEQQTVFIKETALYREEIDFFKLMEEQKPIECSEREERLMKALRITNARIAELIEENYNLKEPKQEWSEEDKNFIKELCNLLASIAKNNYVGCYYAPDLVSKLQSLRPQPKVAIVNGQIWKPSEEQMAVLSGIKHFVVTKDEHAYKVLTSLEKDLEKL